jgi:hypothetical protein
MLGGFTDRLVHRRRPPLQQHTLRSVFHDAWLKKRSKTKEWKETKRTFIVLVLGRKTTDNIADATRNVDEGAFFAERKP